MSNETLKLIKLQFFDLFEIFNWILFIDHVSLKKRKIQRTRSYIVDKQNRLNLKMSPYSFTVIWMAIASRCKIRFFCSFSIQNLKK